MAAPSVEEMIAPISIPSSVLRSNSQAAAKPQMTAVPSVPKIASDSEGRSTGRISSKPAVQPALEQDQRKRDHPDRARQLVVVEVDPAEPVGPDRHPEREEEQQAGQADSRRKQGCANSRSEQGRRDKDQLAVRHPGQRASHVTRPRRRVAP